MHSLVLALSSPDFFFSKGTVPTPQRDGSWDDLHTTTAPTGLGNVLIMSSQNDLIRVKQQTV